MVTDLQEIPFTPCYMFFYGSLMDPDVVQAVLSLDYKPALVEATTKGFTMKMWSIYPTLIRKEGGKISGRVWRVEEESQFQLLQRYETDHYAWCFCDVELENGEILKDCRTFCWAGDEDSSDLEDGQFSLGYYQRYHKPSFANR
jgi:gamma-glutamylcyclotransferase (GGCT)/AIG2-like uncharacterized protein YtfP